MLLLYCIRFYWNLIRCLLQQPIHPLLSEMSVHNNHNYQSAEWREVFGRSCEDQHQKDSFIFIQHSYSVVVDCAQIANTCSRLLLVLFCIAFCSLCAFNTVDCYYCVGREIISFVNSNWLLPFVRYEFWIDTYLILLNANYCLFSNNKRKVSFHSQNLFTLSIAEM